MGNYNHDYSITLIPLCFKRDCAMNMHDDSITTDINVIIIVYSSNETVIDVIPVIDAR